MKRMISLVFILAVFISCKNKYSEPVSFDIETNTITWGHEVNLAKDIIDTVIYIPIEAHKNGLFGRIDKLLMTDDKIFIFDYMNQNAIFAFNKNGKFLFKVGGRGAGPEEYIKIAAFDVDDSLIYIQDATNRDILKYDMNNKFVGRDKFDFMAYGFAKLSNGYIFDYYYYEKHEKTLNGSPRLLITDDNFKTKNEFLPIDNDFCLLRKKTDISKNDKVLTYHAYGMDYVLVSNVLNINEYTIYKFDFKDRKIPSDKRLDAKSCISDKYDYLHDGIFSSKDYMVGTVGVKDVFVIDVNSGKIYTNGETGTFMDLLNKDCRYIYDNYFSVPISMKDNDIVSYLTGEIFQSYDKIQKQNISDDISKHLKADPSNIVLVLQRLSSKNEMR